MTKQKLSRFHWYVWFPYPSSWIKALFITVYLNVIIIIVSMTAIIGYLTAAIVDKPHTVIFFGIFALLTPIPVIAFTHHILHLFLRKYIPVIQTLEMKNTQGFEIKIFSWWEGLYGWVVILISMMIATALCTYLIPLFDLDYRIPVDKYTDSQKKIITVFGIIFIIVAALLYQFEYCFKRNLLFHNNIDHKNFPKKPNINSDRNSNMNKLRGDMGLYKMKDKNKKN
ncbi:hypothetical protein IQ247_07210 [Plectonema cf. radiosum LEGE 06105]|uniref:Uncharacterized protein n=2 Tax=Plectonema TaxID=1183 RepID=A0A8J7EZ20_9CYAN|nr:hypothetical protein [Plectonema cf. radiosum LEGE 06105]